MMRIITLAATVCGLCLLAVSIYMQFRLGYTGDKQWELLYARMWLSGKGLYTDLFAVSPPLIFWLYAIPASIAGPLKDYQMLVLLGLCVTGFSVFLSTRLISLHPEFSGNGAKQWEFAALLCFVLIFRTYCAFFLDREHLFLVLTLPYIIRFMPSLGTQRVPLWLKLSTGSMAAVGFCIKPHCLIVFLGIQLLYCWRERSTKILISSENILIYGIGLAYLTGVALLYPEYFTIVVPMAIATYAATRDENPLWVYGSNALSILVLTFLMFRPDYSSPYRRDIYYWLGLCPFFLFYALTNNNWSYTYYPLSSLALIINGFVLWEFLYLRRHSAKSRWVRRAFLIGSFACAFNFGLRIYFTLNTFPFLYNDSCYSHLNCAGDPLFRVEVAGSPLPHSFGAISINFDRWARLSDYTGAPWETRFSQLWMLPKFFISDENFTRSHHWILEYVGKGFAQDLDVRRPDIIFVDDTAKFYTAHVHVDLVAYLSAIPEFREAWKKYDYIHGIDICGKPRDDYSHSIHCRFDVYRRKE